MTAIRIPRRLLPLPAAAILALAGGAAASAQVTTDWAVPNGASTIAVDAANSVYTAYGTYALGAEITLTKHDVNGNLLWNASYDQTDPTKWENAPFVAVDHAGDVVVSATLMSGYSNPVNAASIVMKFDRDGNFLWRQVYENPFDGSYTRKCLVDASDHIYVLGMGSGPTGFVTRIKKFDPAGNAVWTWYDGVGIGAPLNFKWSPDGYLLITGRGIYGSVNGYAKVDTSGNAIWSRSAYSLAIGDLAGDSLGNTYLLRDNYSYSAQNVIEKIDPVGATLWQATYDLAAQRIEIGPDDLPIACGYPNQGSFGAAFMKVDANGTELWKNRDADGALSLLLHAQLMIDARGAAYLAAGTLFDMAICKVQSDGTSAWTQLTPGGYAFAMALGASDASVFVVGGQTARLIDETGSPWTDLGRGLAGTAGIPLIRGSGELVAGAPVTLDLTDAAPLAPTLLVLGNDRIDLPLFGGTLVPSIDLVDTSWFTDANGEWQLQDTWPSGVPSGDDFFVQVWVADRGAPRKLAGSNALRLWVP